MLIGLACILQSSAAYSEPAKEYDWVFIYYMAFDNDRSVFGETILNEISNGIIDSNVTAVVQADFSDMEGMRRISLSRVNGKLKREEYLLESENSADENEYKKYLEWVEKNWKAKNYAIVLFDHGGTLNSMNLDDKPFKNPGQNVNLAMSEKWQNAMKIGEICRQFHQTTERKVRLLFFHQCGRASLENLYSFVDTADYIMALPVIAFVNNAHCKKMLEYAAQHPNISGAELAQIIMKEAKQNITTLISNNELQHLPERLQRLLNPLEKVEKLSFTDSFITVFHWGDEANYDVKSFLLAIRPSSSKSFSQEIDRFIEWYEQKLIVKKHSKKENYSQLSGLSLHILGNREQMQRYTFLSLYQQTDIVKMFEKLLDQ